MSRKEEISIHFKFLKGQTNLKLTSFPTAGWFGYNIHRLVMICDPKHLIFIHFFETEPDLSHIGEHEHMIVHVNDRVQGR